MPNEQSDLAPLDVMIGFCGEMKKKIPPHQDAILDDLIESVQAEREQLKAVVEAAEEHSLWNDDETLKELRKTLVDLEDGK